MEQQKFAYRVMQDMGENWEDLTEEQLAEVFRRAEGIIAVVKILSFILLAIGLFTAVVSDVGIVGGILVLLVFQIPALALFGKSSQMLGGAVRAFHRQNTPNSGLHYEQEITDKSKLADVLNFDAANAGRPLASYDDQIDSALLEYWSPEFENREKVTVSNEDRGLILGVPGTGKTSYLICQIIDWMQSGKSFVVTDIKPEIWGILQTNGVMKHYGYETTIFNPTHADAHRYNMFDDLISDNDINELINIFIPLEGNDGDAFKENAQRMLKAILLDTRKRYGKTSLPVVREYINGFSSADDMLSDLRDSDVSAVKSIASDIKRAATNERFIASCINALTSALSFLDDEVISNSISESNFSMRETLQKPRQAIFLQFDKRYKETTRTLFGATLAHTLRLLEMEYEDREDVFVLIDEIINSAPIPRFTEKLNVMRSSKMPTFMYLQTTKGLDKIYGEGATELFMSACNFKVCYRINDNKTAKDFSDYVGKTNVRKWGISESDGSSVTSTTQAGSSTQTSSENYSESVEIMNIIEPEQFLQLEVGKAVIIYNGQAALDDMPRHYIDTPAREKPAYVVPTVDQLAEMSA